MKAFTKSIKKTEFLAEVRKHRENDQIVQGTYGKENGKWRGCAVGCSIHSINLLNWTLQKPPPITINNIKRSKEEL